MTRRFTIAPNSPRARESAAKRDALAEHMAEGGSLGGYARLTGKSRRGVEMLWRSIREALGEQAV